MRLYLYQTATPPPAWRTDGGGVCQRGGDTVGRVHAPSPFEANGGLLCVMVQEVVRCGAGGRQAVAFVLNCSGVFPMAPGEGPCRAGHFLLPPLPIPAILAVHFPSPCHLDERCSPLAQARA
jgi:hypothetical protein